MADMNADHPGNERSRKRWLGRAFRWFLIAATLVVVLRLTGCVDRMFVYPIAGRSAVPDYLGEVESVEFASADGTKLHGWFVPAETGDPINGPTVLHVHGNAGNIGSHVGFTDYLPEAGFNVFVFDYRGFGESEGRPTRRDKLLADAEAALNWLLTNDRVRNDQILLYGQSLGAAVALPMMAEREEIVAAVFESSFAGWRSIAADAIGGGLIARGLAWLLVNDHQRPLDAIGKIDRPILLVHGDADAIIPVQHSRRLKQAGGANVELIEYRGGDHNTLSMTHAEMKQDVIEFYHRALPATD